MTLSIRPERLEDIPAIHAVNTLAFGRTAEAELVERIRASPGFVRELSLVAERAGTIVGYALFSLVPILRSTDSKRDANALPMKVQKDEEMNAQNGMKTAATEAVNILALAPLAVRPGFQRKGIGSELVRAGVERGKTLDYRAVGLIGNPMYYSRFGFVPGSTFSLECSYGVPAPVFMVLPLRPEGLAGVEGTFTYPSWFEGV